MKDGPQNLLRDSHSSWEAREKSDLETHNITGFSERGQVRTRFGALDGWCCNSRLSCMKPGTSQPGVSLGQISVGWWTRGLAVGVCRFNRRRVRASCSPRG